MSFFRNPDVRPPAVASLFYPGDAPTLAREVTAYLDQTEDTPLAPGFPKAVIVPHAGYVYSGPVAASAYDLLRPARGIVKRVVILGPCHRVPVRGLALPQASAFATPLGRIPLDAEALGAIRDLPQVVESAETHAEEHALEVQLPFLQRVLGDFSLVPLVVGDAGPEKVAEVLDRLWGGAETLIVISSDLSHYHAYDRAREIDSGTVQAILDFDTGISHDQACGATPVSGLLIAAKRKGLATRLLDCRNSGDTAGDKGRVVGYAAFAVGGEGGGYGAEHGRRLLSIARASITDALGAGSAGSPEANETWLAESRATFVTLMQGEELRGCVGALEAQRPLAVDVAANACAAALEDPRFKPMTRDELARTDIEVSLLSTPKSVPFEDHADLIARLRPGVDGVIIEQDEDRRATFLPQVWEGLPDPEQFIAHLKQKAGIAQNTDIRRCRVRRYSVLKWREAEFRQ